MSKAVINKQDAQNYRLEGELNSTTAPDLLKSMDDYFPGNGGEIIIDLQGVTRSDSAGLALLVEWLRHAQQRQTSLRYANLPKQLREIARISDLLPLLPLA